MNEPEGTIISKRCIRGYCRECGTAMRWPINGVPVELCGECDPMPQGCTSPSSPNDPDAWRVSIQEPYGNVPGY